MCSVKNGSHERMINVRKSFFSLFGLYLIFSNTECCFDDGKLGSFMFFLIILKFSQYVVLMCAQSLVKKSRKVDSVHCLNKQDQHSGTLNV